MARKVHFEKVTFKEGSAWSEGVRHVGNYSEDSSKSKGPEPQAFWASFRNKKEVKMVDKNEKRGK
jgi:hypothetical protein